MRKCIDGFDERYYITDSGDVEFQYEVGKFRKRKLVPDKDGYLTIVLKPKHGKPVCKKVHRLVAFAYIDGFFEGATVNHIDGNKQSNTPDNLEWCTNKQNNLHALSTGLRVVGRRYKKCKPGLYGVSNSSGMFDARVKRGGKNIYLGTYKTKDEACNAVSRAINEELSGQEITPYKQPVKIISQINAIGEIVATYSSIAEAERATGLPNQSIGQVILGKIKSCGGFSWTRKIN